MVILGDILGVVTIMLICGMTLGIVLITTAIIPVGITAITTDIILVEAVSRGGVEEVPMWFVTIALQVISPLVAIRRRVAPRTVTHRCV